MTSVKELSESVSSSIVWYMGYKETFWKLCMSQYARNERERAERLPVGLVFQLVDAIAQRSDFLPKLLCPTLSL